MKKKLVILFVIILILIGLFAVFKVIPLGYDKKDLTGKKDFKVELGVPKLSFMKKENDNSYSYKNLRGNNILKKEIRNYLNTLDKLKCNNTTYYYDDKNDFTIINYNVKNNVLYNTISYEVRKGDYCFNLKMNEYAKKINGLKRYHTLNGEGFKLSEDEEFTPRLVVGFLDDVDLDDKTFSASLHAYYLTPNKESWKSVFKKELETSSGTYEIKGDKLYYTREKIDQKAEDINVPEVSIFKIEDGKLLLIDNYLSNYEEDVILE
ncbi:MAG TPA: hypothetical protein IAB68_02650 [Candidatus Aphodocola excrementigallinarum]|uniref:Uncharacterized protein n=1 Tax=Candidatus Aphodocola excrementigallinarum TaxID=2840670 RepID=A0A9D1INI5_9FIRM|nr:hypothetical protein [Candidatus Aphodocola excrementigallinarum]